MQRFLLQQNIARFQKLLTEETDARSRRTLWSLLFTAQRDLAVLNSVSSGIAPGLYPLRPIRGQFNRSCRPLSRFQREVEVSLRPSLILDPGPGLHIVDINDTYAEVTMVARSSVAGEALFEAFPDNPDDEPADGVSNLYASLRIAAETGKPHAMKIQRYDVRDANGLFVERYWRSLNTPIFDEDGRLVHLLHNVDEVTREILSAKAGVLRRAG